MFEKFDGAKIYHTPYTRHHGSAWKTVLSPSAFLAAKKEISTWDGYKETPLHQLKHLAAELQLAEILYKDESSRFGLGSFKALGAAYAAARVLQSELRRKLNIEVSISDIRNGLYADHVSKMTLVAATDGNHGRSLAWAARMFGAQCQIYIHAAVSRARAEAMELLGAKVIRIKGDYDESVRVASKTSLSNPDYFLISDTSSKGYTEVPRDVMAGYGVLIHEINGSLEFPPTHVLLHGGVGGLAAACSASLRQRWRERSPRVMVVEPELAACLYESARADAVKSVKIEEETIMAGLSCGEPSILAWQVLREEVSDFVKIPDSIIPPTMRLLAHLLGGDQAIEAGETGAASLAALIAIARQPALRVACDIDCYSRVLVIGSEGATDPQLYDKIVNAEES